MGYPIYVSMLHKSYVQQGIEKSSMYDLLKKNKKNQRKSETLYGFWTRAGQIQV